MIFFLSSSSFTLFFSLIFILSIHQSHLHQIENASSASPASPLASPEEIHPHVPIPPPTTISESPPSSVPAASIPTPIPPVGDTMLSFEEWRKKIAQLDDEKKQSQAVMKDVSHVHSPQVNSVDSKTGTHSDVQASAAKKIVQPGQLTKLAKNMASSECGSKVVDSNPEAEFVLRILNEQGDEYMLNPCRAKIWMVIELCESIQPSRLELANFELFSSVPKEFNIYASDRYPTREWSFLGNFTASDSRNLQTFPLLHEGFVKFMKIELLSHYGSEHFCPLSVVRLFGTSLFDEVERMDNQDQVASGEREVHSIEADQFDSTLREEMIGSEPATQNLFGSAKEAVYSIVRKAASAFNGNQAEISVDTKINGTDIATNNKTIPTVNQTVCHSEELTSKSNVSKTTDIVIRLFPLVSSYLCDCVCNNSFPTNISANFPPICFYMKSMLGNALYDVLIDQVSLVTCKKDNSLIMSLFQCPSIANSSKSIEISLKEEKVVEMNHLEIESSFQDLGETTSTIIRSIFDNLSTMSDAMTSKVTQSISFVTETSRIIDDPIQITTIENANSISNINSGDEDKVTSEASSISEQIVNTIVTQIDDESESISTSISTSSVDKTSSDIQSIDPTKADETPVESVRVNVNVTTSDDKTNNENATKGEEIDANLVQTIPSSTDTNASSSLTQVDNNKADGVQVVSQPHTNGHVVSGQSKESVVIRLSNRIKALEVNLSLSSQYLEELSQRYKRQMEEMNRAFTSTINQLNETATRAAEKDQRQQELISSLEAKISYLNSSMIDLLSERENFNLYFIEIHIGLMILEVLMVMIIMVICVRSSKSRKHHDNHQIHQDNLSHHNLPSSSPSSPNKRPNSSPIILHNHLPAKTKRIEGDLILVEPNRFNENIPLLFDVPRKTRKKKKKRSSVAPLGVTQIGNNQNNNIDIRSLQHLQEFGKGKMQDDKCARNESNNSTNLHHNKSNGLTDLKAFSSLVNSLDVNQKDKSNSSCHSSTSGISSNSYVSDNVLSHHNEHHVMNNSKSSGNTNGIHNGIHLTQITNITSDKEPSKLTLSNGNHQMNHRKTSSSSSSSSSLVSPLVTHKSSPFSLKKLLKRDKRGESESK